jgi:hypothetical protein
VQTNTCTFNIGQPSYIACVEVNVCIDCGSQLAKTRDCYPQGLYRFRITRRKQEPLSAPSAVSKAGRRRHGYSGLSVAQYRA